MGKSLIIKGANFSANGMPVEYIAGSDTQTNDMSGLNIDLGKEFVNGLGLAAGTTKFVLRSDDASVNSILNGKSITVISSGDYSVVGAFEYGNPFTISVPMEHTFMLQQADVSGLAGKVFILDVFEN